MSDSPEDDLLSSVLNAYQMRAGIYGNPTLCGSWQVGMHGHKRAAFHYVGRGHCWLHTRLGHPAEPLQGGDLVVFPHDAWHMLSSEPELRGNENRMTPRGDGPFTTLVCGYFEFKLGGQNPVLDALPELIVVRRDEAHRHLQKLGELLVDEAQVQEEPGTHTVLDKLADALFVMVVRHHVNRAVTPERTGVLAALADTRVRRALAVMHRDPSRRWTVESLAGVATMSRAAFAQRFAELIGATPMEYLTRWRMTQAELLLRQPQSTVAQAAQHVGYAAEAAFRKAFKRVHGIGPGALRRGFRAQLGKDNGASRMDKA
jgi:AraC family transcriptional regulator, activator of mtrCDE